MLVLVKHLVLLLLLEQMLQLQVVYRLPVALVEMDLLAALRIFLVVVAAGQVRTGLAAQLLAAVLVGLGSHLLICLLVELKFTESADTVEHKVLMGKVLLAPQIQATEAKVRQILAAVQSQQQKAVQGSS